MRIGIVGSGHIGSAAARLFVRAGHEVAVSHQHSPDDLRDLVEELGPRARAGTVEEAARFGDVVLLALPWRARASLPRHEFADKIVIDATNPYAPDFSLYDLGDSTSSEEVAKELPRARIVKAFNTLRSNDLATRGKPGASRENRIALFVAGDDDEANRVVARLVEDIGFAPVFTGSLRDGGRLQQPGSPVYTVALGAEEGAAALGLGPEAVAPPPGS
jgi:predicted dinucleotide-binding enzyme